MILARFPLILIGSLAIFIWASVQTNARPLVAEISSHDIVVHSAFKGTELILFGTRNAAGDIVVVVRGPDAKAVVRKKQKVFGLWVNRLTEEFHDIPAFYAMASSKKYADIKKSVYFDALKIGYMQAIESFHSSALSHLNENERATREEFSKALIRALRQEQVYQPQIAPITFIGDGLFRATIPFPDNTPTGDYGVEVYLVADGVVQAMHTTSIHVYKTGLDATMYQLSQKFPLLYGMLAIAIAISGGLLAVKLCNRG
jgi:uncharacterized protein (TIGR02186 family)